MKILKRGYLPGGGGEIQIVIPSIKNLKKINLTEKGYIKRVRGVCCGSKISTNLLNEAVSKARSIFNNYIPDVWIFTDFYKGDKASISSGFSLSLVA
jgi:RNA 3'-terminal phosphate cyclase-like protein